MRTVPIAVLDACVLVPMPLADTLLRQAESPSLFEARWSEEILLEVRRAMERKLNVAPEKVLRREQAMRLHFPHAIVRGVESVTPWMRNHPKDRHVLACAVACHADYLVTFNRKDFPTRALDGLQTSVIAPSAFLDLIWRREPREFRSRLRTQSAAVGLSAEALVDRLAFLLGEPDAFGDIRAHLKRGD
ncbi:MAG: PIN domain-containing protein [Acidobacteria bacterium]|nr:PIN domain-containing protein [Acidobacteriota bacterium]